MKLVNIQVIKDELERLIRNYRFYSSTEAKYRYEAYKELSEWLDGFEVGEPSKDLEEEIELVKGDYEQVDVAWNNDFDSIARHFFELGLKAQKGE